MSKRLTRSSDSKISGVCGGIANYFDIDPTITRAIYAVLTIFSFGIGGVLLYIVLAFIMPAEDSPK